MRRIERFVNNLRPKFEKGKLLAPLKPIFDAADNFILSPAEKTATGPHVRDPLEIKRYMSMVIIALLPCFAASVYFFGLRIIVMIAVSYIVGGAVEVLFAVIRKEEIYEGFLVTGFIFPLVLPPATPLWMVGAGIAFGVIVGKEVFGGTGRNLFNPALVGRCFLAISYPASLTGAWLKPGSGFTGRIFQYVDASAVEALSSATPLALAKQGVSAPSFMDMILGRIPGSAGETCAIAIIAGGVFLLITRVSNWRTVVSILGSFLGLGALLGFLCPDLFGSVGWHFFAGGLLFGAFFMATDPVTGPTTTGGKWAYGVLIGSVTVLIRNLTGYVEGVTFAILLGNIAAPLFDEIVVWARIRKLRNEG